MARISPLGELDDVAGASPDARFLDWMMVASVVNYTSSHDDTGSSSFLVDSTGEVVVRPDNWDW